MVECYALRIAYASCAMVVDGSAARLQNEFIHFRFDSGIVLMVKKTKVDMSNWQCRLPGCSSVGKFKITEELIRSYVTTCRNCKLVNVFMK